MVIKIKKHTFLKPLRCPICNKFRLFVKYPQAKCCKKCHAKQRRISQAANRRYQRRQKTYKYSVQYQSRRKREIKEHPYCSLCGTEHNLTAHHVGGNCEHLTVLCDECHQAYERWNNKRKVKQCKKKMLTVGLSSWRNITQIVRFHCLMCFCRIRLHRVGEHREAQSAFANSVNGNITD